MFVYQKKLQYPVRIKNTNPKLASLIISQYGGPECQRGGRESVPEFVKKNEEIMTNSLLYDLVNQMYLNTDRQDEAPKDKIFDCMREIRGTAVKAPVRIGDIIIRNCAGTGVDVIATKNVPAVSESPKAGL